jgi:hypothetical protein
MIRSTLSHKSSPTSIFTPLHSQPCSSLNSQQSRITLFDCSCLILWKMASDRTSFIQLSSWSVNMNLLTCMIASFDDPKQLSIGSLANTPSARNCLRPPKYQVPMSFTNTRVGNMHAEIQTTIEAGIDLFNNSLSPLGCIISQIWLVLHLKNLLGNKIIMYLFKITLLNIIGESKLKNFHQFKCNDNRVENL